MSLAIWKKEIAVEYCDSPHTNRSLKILACERLEGKERGGGKNGARSMLIPMKNMIFTRAKF